MKHPILSAFIACSLLAGGTAAAAAGPAQPEPTATPRALPPAPLPARTAVPTGKATPKPPPPGRIGISGVWEVQIQRGPHTTYTHFKLHQRGTTLFGTYLNQHGKQFRLHGTVSGKFVKVIVAYIDGTKLVFKGRLSGTTDMLGMLREPKAHIAFTAAYRPKYNFMEDISPGGMGGGLGGANTPYIPPRRLST
ncbi:MAG: hypothetical protein ACYDHD_11190 [Vulcanimicrobiaceae bacterium]